MNASVTACMEAAGGMVSAGLEDTSQDKVQLKVVHMMERCVSYRFCCRWWCSRILIITIATSVRNWSMFTFAAFSTCWGTAKNGWGSNWCWKAQRTLNSWTLNHCWGAFINCWWTDWELRCSSLLTSSQNITLLNISATVACMVLILAMITLHELY